MSSAVKKPTPRSGSESHSSAHSSGHSSTKTSVSARRNDKSVVSSGRLARLEGNVSVPSTSEDSFSLELIERIGHLLEASMPGRSCFVAQWPGGAEIARIAWTNGSFRSALDSPLDLGNETLSRVVNSASRSPNIVKDVRNEKLPSSIDPREGSMCFLRFENGRSHALVGIHQAGHFTMRETRALVTVLELAELASSSAGSVRELVAHELRMEGLRAEIARLQSFYRKFSDSILQCFWVVDLESHRVITVSDNFEKVWGASRRILNRGLTGFMESVYPEDRDRVLAEFHNRLGSDLSIELRVIEGSGEIRWLWLRASSTFGDDGVDEGTKQLLLIADDVTEKKQEEERLRAREATLVAQARHLAVGDLASGVAHEINNPLTIIVGKASELRRLLESEATNDVSESANDARAKGKEIADKIQSTAIRISKIIMSLKAVARKERPLELVKVPLFPMVGELRDLCSARFRAHEVLLDLPETDLGLEAELNPTLISQVLLNLVNNAFDAVQSEKEKWVRVEFSDDEDSLYIAVTDSGPGIPIKNRGRIFDPFFTTKEPGKGTGLGLSLAASIAAHHGGSIRLDNLNAHTRFVLQLPKNQARPSTKNG